MGVFCAGDVWSRRRDVIFQAIFAQQKPICDEPEAGGRLICDRKEQDYGIPGRIGYSDDDCGIRGHHCTLPAEVIVLPGGPDSWFHGASLENFINLGDTRQS